MRSNTMRQISVIKALLRRTLICGCWVLFALTAYQAAAAPPTTAPFGSTIQAGGVNFRLWAPFVDSVAVKVNGAQPVALTQEPGHTDPTDTVWVGTLPNAKAGDPYRYLIQCNNTTAEFNDPRARQLTSTDALAQSVIVDTLQAPPAFDEPSFNSMVVYELHIGTFNPATADGKYNFAGATEKLDYLKDLGINAIELMPVHENIVGAGHVPADFDWGYDPAQLYAVKAAYGSPQDFQTFVGECHKRGIAVILDVVYNHLVENNMLTRFGGFSVPTVKDGVYFYGDNREDTGFGPRPDFGRPQVRQYIDDNALMWLRDYGVDGLRFDSTINIRAFNNDNHFPIKEGAEVLQETNNAYRDTDPKQPGKITIAEDLQGVGTITVPVSQGGLGFNSQWDQSLFYSLRSAVVAVNDQDRNLADVKGSIEKKLGTDVFSRVIFSENHDKVGHPTDDNQRRLPILIDTQDPESIFARKRSTLAAAVVLTSPGIPMIFQGQEILESRDFNFSTATMMDWARLKDPKLAGIVQMYRDLIALRRNLAQKTRGLTGQSLNVFHLDSQTQTLAYQRWENGGSGDDVIVVVNLSNQPIPVLNIGFPRGGKWIVRFNSGATIYGPDFDNGDSFDTVANAGAKDGLNFNGNVGIGSYSVVILSQD